MIKDKQDEMPLAAMTFSVPVPVLRVLWQLEHAGYPAYIVGGSLRDIMLDRQPHDWDVTTAARPQHMLDVFGAAGLTVIPTGLAHGTVTVLIDHCAVECTTYRIDGVYTDARHPDHVEFTDRIADDLSRRDFTICAMACRLPAVRDWANFPEFPEAMPNITEHDIELIDLFGGREDLNAHIIRCVGDAVPRFTEDALRMLRAVRFGVQLEFEIDPATEAALVIKREGLSRISAERITAELTRMLDCSRPSRGLSLLYRTGLWQYVLPEVHPAEHPSFEKESMLFAAADTLPNDAMLRLALLLSGNIATARHCCRRLKLSNKQTETVITYIAASRCSAPVTDTALRHYMATYGQYTDRALLLASVCAPDKTRISYLHALDRIALIRARGDCLSVADLAIDGQTVMTELGLHGPAVGHMLRALFDAVLEDPSRNTRDRLIEIAQKK